jgi:hypothetical protein
VLAGLVRGNIGIRTVKLAVIPLTGKSNVKIEDVMEIMVINLRQADEAVKDSQLSQATRSEALGAKKAYAHCIGLLTAALQKKGWK